MAVTTVLSDGGAATIVSGGNDNDGTFSHRFSWSAAFAGAFLATAVTFFLLAYRSGLIRVTQKFTLGVVAATGGIAVFYLITMVLGLFHIQVPIVYGNSNISIIFSLIATFHH